MSDGKTIQQLCVISRNNSSYSFLEILFHALGNFLFRRAISVFSQSTKVAPFHISGAHSLCSSLLLVFCSVNYTYFLLLDPRTQWDLQVLFGFCLQSVGVNLVFSPCLRERSPACCPICENYYFIYIVWLSSCLR